MTTRAQVIAALAEQRVNRPRALADANIRSLLRQFGNGASTIGELDPTYYENVWRAAGGSMSAEDFYGVVSDVPVIDATEPAKITMLSQKGAPIIPSLQRFRSPLVAELEARLRERAGKPRSKPTMHVDYGSPAQFGDQRDDVVREYPSGDKLQ